MRCIEPITYKKNINNIFVFFFLVRHIYFGIVFHKKYRLYEGIEPHLQQIKDNCVI